MANNNETTMRFNADISGLKKGLSDANRQIKLANSQFAAAASAMDDWSKSADGLNAKITQLESVQQSETKKLELLRQQYELTAAEMGENSKEAEELLIQINRQQTTVNNVNSDLTTYRNRLDEITDSTNDAGHAAENNVSAYDRLTREINDQESELQRLQREYAGYVLEGNEASNEAQELSRDIQRLSSEINENKTALNNADSAAESFAETMDETADATHDAADGAKTLSDGFSVIKGAAADLVSQGIQLLVNALKEVVAETINVGRSFDAEMSKVGAISGAAAEDVALLRDKAKELGAATKFSASEVASGFEYMAMAGWKTDDMLNGIEGILALSAASGTDLATTSDIVTDALTGMGYAAGDAGRLADVMAVASSNANTNVEMMGETFKYVAPVIGSMGYTMEDAAVSIGLMANAGIKSTQAGTALRSIITRIATDAGASSKSLGALGVLTEELGVQFYDSEGNARDLNVVLEESRQAWAKLGDAEAAEYGKKIAGTNALSAWLALMNAAPEDVDKLTNAVNNASGAAAEMADIMQNNLDGDITKLNSKIEGLQIELYEKLEPALRSGVELLSKLADGFGFLIDHGNEVVAVLTALATGVASYLVYTTALTVMTEGWAALTIVTKAQAAAQAALNAVMALNPIGLVVAAIAALIAAFIYLWNTSDEFREFWINLWDKITDAASVAVEAVKNFFIGIWDWIKENWQGLLLLIVNPFAGAFKLIYDNFDGFKNFVDKIVGAVSGYFKYLWDNISKGAAAAWNTIVKFFEPATSWFSKLFTSIKNTFNSVLTVIIGLAKGCWEIISRVYELAAEWFRKNITEPISTFFAEMWDKISSSAKTAWDFISNTFSAAAAWLNDTIIKPVTNFFTEMWESVKTGASDAWDGIKSVFSTVAEFFGNIFKEAWEKVKNVFSVGGQIFDGIKDGITSAFKNIVNAIIRGINNVVAIPFGKINDMLNKIHDLEILGIKPFENLWSKDPLAVPKIPELARGGVLKRGQVGLLEGDGAEAVIPLEKNTEWIKRVAAEMSRSFGGGSGAMNTFKGNTVNNYNFNQTNNSPKALNRLEIYRQSKQQTAFIKAVTSNV